MRALKTYEECRKAKAKNRNGHIANLDISSCLVSPIRDYSISPTQNGRQGGRSSSYPLILPTADIFQSFMQLIAGPSRIPWKPLSKIPIYRSYHRRDKTLTHHSKSYVRLNSTTTPSKPSNSKDIPIPYLTEEEQRAYDRLSPIISSLPGPIDWAVAYGSGVRHQANTDPSGVSSLLSSLDA